MGRQHVDCMTRNMKDKLRIFSDKKLLTTGQKAKGRADRFIGYCVKEDPMFM